MRARQRGVVEVSRGGWWNEHATVRLSVHAHPCALPEVYRLRERYANLNPEVKLLVDRLNANAVEGSESCTKSSDSHFAVWHAVQSRRMFGKAIRKCTQCSVAEGRLKDQSRQRIVKRGW